MKDFFLSLTLLLVLCSCSQVQRDIYTQDSKVNTNNPAVTDRLAEGCVRRATRIKPEHWKVGIECNGNMDVIVTAELDGLIEKGPKGKTVLSEEGVKYVLANRTDL